MRIFIQLNESWNYHREDNEHSYQLPLSSRPIIMSLFSLLIIVTWVLLAPQAGVVGKAASLPSLVTDSTEWMGNLSWP